MRPDLFDMHCHLGFCSDAAQAARELSSLGVGAFSNTVTPAEFAVQKEVLAGATNVRVGAGLHPWWVGGEGELAKRPAAQVESGMRACCSDENPAGESSPVPAAVQVPAAAQAFAATLSDTEQLCGLIARHRFVGEVGLDLSPRHSATREAQMRVFSAVARAVAQAGGRVLSVHAVRSASEVLDVLARAGAFSTDAACACVMHWFSGTSDELTRARRLGCCFSVNPRMLESKRGRAYVAAIPLDRLTLETDLPSAAGKTFDAQDVRDLLERTAVSIATVKRCEVAEVLESAAYNSRELLSL